MAHKTVERGNSGTRALRRVARHYVSRAQGALSEPVQADSGVHDARKALKKSRTVLRLLRAALGRATYRRENTLLRDAAHSLNPIRDGKVLVQTLQSLRHTYPPLRTVPGIVALWRTLRDEQHRLQQQLVDHPDQLAAARGAIAQVRTHSAHWDLGGQGWSVIGPGLRRIYRQGRRVLPAASPRPGDAAMHEWRKQVKYLRYALRILAPIDPEQLGALVKQADGLSECLGRSHDLAVLGARARTFAEHEQTDVHPLIEAIDEQAVLRIDALVAGERLYRQRPRDFEQRMGRHWHHWRHGRGSA